MRSKISDRFIRYAKIDTQSDPKSGTCPSTKKQLHLAMELVKELNGMGLHDVSLDKNGYVMATLPSNLDFEVPVIGLLAHMDTSPDFTGTGVKPQLHKNYQGGDIILNKKKNIVLSPVDFPELLRYIGNDLICTDGNTLLGADNKAGAAEIMCAVEFLTENPHLPHGTIKIGFTPDEEIGRGADKFDVEKFAADFAYTVDGGELGELEYENFNAAQARLKFFGRNVHPGTAKNKMVNSILMAIEFQSLLPVNERPEFTEKYEGFYMLTDFAGSVENSELTYIIRDHDLEKFKKKKEFFNQSVELIRLKYGHDCVHLDIKDQYFNMKEKIEPVMQIIHLAERAMREVGVEPIIKPVRGGTDGSRLSFMGLPTPNLFSGGHNYHGKYEFIPVQSMEKAVEVILKIVELNAKK
ncbi:MAG: peptidase T [Bacteroidales bacterium]